MDVSVSTIGAFQENCYLLVSDGHAVFVDPGAESAQLLDKLEATGAVLDAIWLTHAHLDHIGGVAGILRLHRVPVFLHKADLPLYRNGYRQAAAYGLPFDQPPDPTNWIEEGDVLTVGSQRFSALHLPGHAPGHMAFVAGRHCFSGDLLFAGSIGRTDLPLCDPGAMVVSLQRMSEMPDDTVVYPGHGPTTTIGVERSSNPYFSGKSGW